MIVVSDAHVSDARGNSDAFFSMLTAIDDLDGDVVFLGDIFDLWIGYRRFESKIQARFLDWVATARELRSVGFVEGNHEFYVVSRHAGRFDWATRSDQACGRVHFAHGDLVNSRDHAYLRFRRLTKNSLMRAMIGVLPVGMGTMNRLKDSLSGTNQAFKTVLPQAELARYASRCWDAGFQLVVLGHFHHYYELSSDSGRLLVMPDWLTTGRIACIDSSTCAVRIGHWERVGQFAF